MKITCSRELHFSAGHRVKGHENKCANVHGHNYIAVIHATADKLDSIGRVIDFSVIKGKVGSWIDDHWDHTFICHKNEDKELINAIQKINNKSIYFMLDNPTAENMAKLLLDTCTIILAGTNVLVVQVDIWETANCFATASL